MIKINGKELKTTAPKNLDAQLIAATGCSSAEIGTLLSAGADRAAAALRPFLDDKDLPGSELARAIAADRDAVAVIRDLYAEQVKPAAPVTEAK